MNIGDEIQKLKPFHLLNQMGNLWLLLLWYIIHIVVSIWYFAYGLCQILESYLISSGYLKQYKTLDPSRVRYLAVVLDSEEARRTSEVIELVRHLAGIGVKNVCLYDSRGLLKKSKEVIMASLGNAKLFEEATKSDSLSDKKYITLEFASSADGKEAVAKAANYLLKKNYLSGEQKELTIKESDISEALKEIGFGQPDPDLLLVYGAARCHLGFPAWRIRYTEIVYMGPLKSMKYGSLIKAIHKFTKVQQNYGT